MNSKNNINEEQYNPVAEKYSEELLKYNKESIAAYFAALQFDFKGKTVLDLGCGDGYDLSRITSMGAHSSGIDSSAEMVRLARIRNPEAIIEIARFDEIPFSDSSFDFVISKWAIQTTKEIEQVYAEIVRVLKPGGKLIFLACHPIRQFIEKQHKEKNYFEQEIVHSTFFGGQITALEPSHTFNEYLSPYFFKHFILGSFSEGWDSAPEMIGGDTYPSYFILQATLKNGI